MYANFLPIYILLGVLFQYFKIWLISHDSVTTQSFENGGVDSACFFTESTQSPTPTPMAGITTFMYFEYNHEIHIDNMKFATTFRKFNQSIIDEIEHTVVYGHC